MLCIGIIWNNVFHLKDEILEDIRNNDLAKVFESFDLDLDDDYENFVRGIYSLDSIATWKVDKKVSTMLESTDSRSVNVIFMEVNDSNQEYHELKKRYVYTDLENLKVFIRGKYKEKISNYFFDNVFHMTDNKEEFEQTYDFLKKYLTEQYSNKGGRIPKIIRIRREENNEK